MKRVTIFKWLGISGLLALLSVYGWLMVLTGGLERIPSATPVPELRVTERNQRLLATGEDFSFAVLGDMRWSSPPRIAALDRAQARSPLFMVNLGDVVEYSRKTEWRQYIGELNHHWDRRIPYFHLPGNHSLNLRLDGIRPALFSHYFGAVNFRRETGLWSFIFLDSSGGYLSGGQLEWLRGALATAARRRQRTIIFMHHPPFTLLSSSAQRLAATVADHNVAAIFSAHIHTLRKDDWQGIPVYITALHQETWRGQPAQSGWYNLVTISGRQLTVTAMPVPPPPIWRRSTMIHFSSEAK